MGWLAQWRCLNKGHEWWPEDGPREFIPTVGICWRCHLTMVWLPYGTCLRVDHPLSEHYDTDGHQIAIDKCAGPL